jgi:Protein of unknown function (DUF3152)
VTHPVTRRRTPPRGRPVRPREPFRPPYDLVRLRAPDGPLRARLDPTGTAGRRPGARPARRRGLRGFVSRHGWRAWAIPLLTVATFLCLMDIAKNRTDATSGSAAAPAAGSDASAAAPAGPAAANHKDIYVDSPSSAGDLNGDLPSTALPAGGPYAMEGNGRFDVVPGWSRVYGRGGPLERFTVEVEGGVTIDKRAFARAVELTLGDPHSWGGGGRMTFQRVDSGPVDFRVSLASSMTVRRLCGYTLPFETSCYNGDIGRAIINDARWVRGAVAYGFDLASYRVYVINHEVGHALGHGHEPCPRAGALAPVMLQQTLGLETAGVGTCRRNPWPYP